MNNSHVFHKFQEKLFRNNTSLTANIIIGEIKLFLVFLTAGMLWRIRQK